MHGKKREINIQKSTQNNSRNTDLDEDSILVICAHSDDQIFGPGGTIAKYAKEGKKIHTIIFSYGEGSHPWFKKEYTISARVKEALAVDKFIGGDGVVFLGLEEGKFREQYTAKNVYDIWNLFNFKKRHYANIAVDISATFDTKIKALKLFKSQKIALFTLMWSVYFRAWINGQKHKMRYAEIFYKIR